MSFRWPLKISGGGRAQGSVRGRPAATRRSRKRQRGREGGGHCTFRTDTDEPDLHVILDVVEADAEVLELLHFPRRCEVPFANLLLRHDLHKVVEEGAVLQVVLEIAQLHSALIQVGIEP
jgi:hypothetical protein